MLRPEAIGIVPPEETELHGRLGARQRMLVGGAAVRPLLVDAPNTILAAPWRPCASPRKFRWGVVSGLRWASPVRPPQRAARVLE